MLLPPLACPSCCNGLTVYCTFMGGEHEAQHRKGPAQELETKRQKLQVLSPQSDVASLACMWYSGLL